MSKYIQINKNLKLSEKLANYITKNNITFPYKKTSLIVFSKKDEELNKLNTELVGSLLKEGRKVLKAQEKNNNTWEFTAINP